MVEDHQYYDDDFFKLEGWVSCYECDIIFYDIDKLIEHQKECDKPEYLKLSEEDKTKSTVDKPYKQHKELKERLDGILNSYIDKYNLQY